MIVFLSFLLLPALPLIPLFLLFWASVSHSEDCLPYQIPEGDVWSLLIFNF